MTAYESAQAKLRFSMTKLLYPDPEVKPQGGGASDSSGGGGSESRKRQPRLSVAVRREAKKATANDPNNPFPDDGIGIDFFVSHNWHDENADQRWAALIELSDRFLDRYGRLPR